MASNFLKKLLAVGAHFLAPNVKDQLTRRMTKLFDMAQRKVCSWHCGFFFGEEAAITNPALITGCHSSVAIHH